MFIYPSDLPTTTSTIVAVVILVEVVMTMGVELVACSSRFKTNAMVSKSIATC